MFKGGDIQRNIIRLQNLLRQTKYVDIPSSQIWFLKGFILPSFNCLIDMFPSLQFTIDNAEDNLKQWAQYQKEKRLTGWTPEKDKKKGKDEKDSNKK